MVNHWYGHPLAGGDHTPNAESFVMAEYFNTLRQPEYRAVGLAVLDVITVKTCKLMH